ncbi:MAG TPA: SIR2 family protein [Thermoanaerobaculia bacterium]|nr:SIR2 family protein [Thermoanaerobaculia bacterium]
MLLRLPSEGILTTNYDTLIEDAAIEGGRPLRVVTDGDAFNRASSKRDNEVTVLGYLHGSFRRNRELVATTDDYINSYARSGARWRDLLRTIFRTRTVVFIGYSLRDFTTWTSYISTRLSTRQQANSRRVHLMVAPNASPHFHAFWKRYGVKYVPLTAGQFLTAVHAKLGTLGDFDIAAAAVGAASRKSLRRSRRILEGYKAETGWNCLVAADQLIGKALNEHHRKRHSR